MRLSNVDFLAKMKEHFSYAKHTNTISVTVKYYDYKIEAPKKEEMKKSNKKSKKKEPKEGFCIMRAVLFDKGKKKLSTLVHSSEVAQFQKSYLIMRNVIHETIRTHNKKHKKKKDKKKLKLVNSN